MILQEPKWPQRIPADLQRRLEETLSMRWAGPVDVWATVVEWSQLHGVQPPDRDLPDGFTKPKGQDHAPHG